MLRTHCFGVLIICFLLPVSGWSLDSCRDCHEDLRQMTGYGYGQLAVLQREVEIQSGMPAGCSDCHLGNPAASDRAAAHKGMGRLKPVHQKGFAVISSPRKHSLEFGNNQTNRMFLSSSRNGNKERDSSITAILYQDKRSDTLSQDFGMMEKSCGNCHSKEFSEFTKSTMATNGKQSQYRGWTDKKRGPHNCGPWFEGNLEQLRANGTQPLTDKAAAIGQKSCNTCHVGCLDCHYNPQPKNLSIPSHGVHTFVKTPASESCYGNGRGSVCHAGPEDRRRGAGYFGGSYSFPEGAAPDVHLKAKVGCLDCHESSRSNPTMGHAMVKRQAHDSCVRCHGDAVKKHAASLHRNLSCEACHISNVGGYQGTYWGPGKLAGEPTPYFKFKAYYGIMAEPFLIKNQQGRWIPVKPFPMAVMNQKNAPYTPGLQWRFPKELPDLQRTDDAWAYVGLFGGMPENNNALIWIQMDKLSHKYGKSRSCDSCHADLQGRQRQHVAWEYSDPGAFPFQGSHLVIGDKSGLFIKEMRSEKIELETGYTLSSLAPWVYLKDKWQITGNFALPVISERAAYEALKQDQSSARRSGVIH